MNTIFMNSENSRTSEYLRRSQESVALSNHSICYTWKNITITINLKYLSDEFELSNRLHSVSDIQDYFEYILKKHSENVDNPSLKIYVNKIENRTTFKIKNGYYLEKYSK